VPRSEFDIRPGGSARALRELWAAEPIDPAEAEFRLNSVSAGAWVTVIVCVPALIYAPTVGGRSDTMMFLAIWVIALIGGLVAFLLPWETIIRSRWRELAFLTWTLLDLTLIGLAAIKDGGPDSPVTWLFFAPIVFVGASYPTWSVKLVGVIGLSGYVVFGVAYGEPWGRLVLGLGGLGAAALMSWWQAHNHERRRRELARFSITDPLTGALNRRGLDAAAAASLAAMHRAGTPVALILIDLDDFKAYNDSFGHAAGDELLCWTAARVRSALRAMDSLARIGGDEFAIVVADADASAAAAVAERVRTACADRISLCTGLGSAPEDGNDFDSLYRVADGALYDTKRRCRPYQPPSPAPTWARLEARRVRSADASG
jgi:diguanylate cyclase (GGDEF)-like protein